MTTEKWQNLLRIASELRRSDRIPEAIAAYKLLLAEKNDLAESWYNLGLLQRQARAFDEALHAYTCALRLGIEQPEEVHLNRAVILSDYLHRSEDAEQELRTALQMNPTYVPALLNLGNLLEDFGRLEEARAAYRRALSADPRNSLALARVAGLSHATTLDVELANQLRSEIDAEGTMPADKADLGFALAALLDAAGQHEEAFKAAQLANQSSRQASGVWYDRSRVELFVDRSIAAFTKPVERVTTAGAPVFICGMFRSGSTLIERILASHGSVTAGGELEALPLLFRQIDGYPEAAVAANAEMIAAWRDQYMQGLPVMQSASQLLTDKRPDNFLYIGFIKMLFPDAKIIHTYRSPLDNLLSLYFLHLDPSAAYALSLEDAAHWYRQYQRLMAHWKSLFQEDIFDVDYDELVREPAPVLSGLLKFLSLEPTDGLLDFYRIPGRVKTASVWQVRQPIHSRSSGRWRNYERHLEPFRGMLPPTQSL